MRLQGKVSLITGMDSEVGRAIAVAFAREGSKVAGCCQSPERAEETVRAVEALGGSCLVVAGDPSKPDDAKGIVEKVVQRFGGLDVLVNFGASRRVVGTIMDITEEEFNEEMAADLKAVIFLSRCAIPAMAQTGGGSIINHSSIAAAGVKARALRSASKAALNALTVAMALDHGPQNIRVNALLIGPTLTSDMTRNPQQLSKLEQEAALKKLHKPEDVAAAALFFASDEAKHITGVLFPLDAGRSLPTF
jgi:NAD(P)-dependent dehydrogenase (short-subunit alcohol dehydrogenase family)